MIACPWSDWQPATIKFCENLLCSWITQPANTWSNLAYILVGILTYRLAERQGHSQLNYIGVMAVLVGLGSFFFHASSTFAGEVADVGAMFLFANYVLICNWRRWRGVDWERMNRWYTGLMAISMLLLLTLRWVGILLFALLITVAGLIEIRLYWRDRGQVDYRPLAKLCGLFAAAFLLWSLDRRGILCDPDNHILQGHAAWHIINSFCFYQLYRFYAPQVAARRL
jgi:hypothetical protein